MIDKNFKFPTKLLGPSNLIKDGKYYGTSEYTWDFNNHWPQMTIDFVENATNINIISKAESEEQAEANLSKIARISRLYTMSNIPKWSQKTLEYRVAKDNDVLLEVLYFQLEILQTWGGYNSLYRPVTETGIGKAAEMYFNGSSLSTKNYNYEPRPEEYRKDY